MVAQCVGKFSFIPAFISHSILLICIFFSCIFVIFLRFIHSLSIYYGCAKRGKFARLCLHLFPTLFYSLHIFSCILVIFCDFLRFIHNLRIYYGWARRGKIARPSPPTSVTLSAPTECIYTNIPYLNIHFLKSCLVTAILLLVTHFYCKRKLINTP